MKRHNIKCDEISINIEQYESYCKVQRGIIWLKRHMNTAQVHLWQVSSVTPREICMNIEQCVTAREICTNDLEIVQNAVRRSFLDGSRKAAPGQPGHRALPSECVVSMTFIKLTIKKESQQSQQRVRWNYTICKMVHLYSMGSMGNIYPAESARAFTNRRCPHSGGGKTFWRVGCFFFTKTATPRKQKVENQS